jgi:trimethylamine---corrinoid protein Co-methyltransferase
MNNIEFLKKNEIEKIHSLALKNLWEFGFWVNETKILKFLAEKGCSVNLNEKIVKFPTEFVEECLNTAPRSFKMGARERSNIVTIGKDKIHTRPMSGCHQILDLNSGVCRLGLASDVINCTLLVNNLENYSYMGAIIYPSEEAPILRDVHVAKLMLENSLKHVRFQPFEAKNLKYVIEFCKTLIKNEEESINEPLISIVSAPSSPLKYSKNEIEIFELASKNKIPVEIGSTPISGATGPVTLAGQLALIHTETLAGLTILQAINPGTPVIYSPRPNTMDMRTGSALWGAIEFGITSAACVQLAHYINVPTDIMGAGTDSKTLDEQTGMEKAMNLSLAALSGSDIVSGLGFIETINTASYEQLLMDNELAGMMFRVLKGIDINDEKLAIDVIREIGFHGNFLSHEHTREYFREEHYITNIFDRKSRDAWNSAGSKELAEVGNDKVREVLKNAEAPHLEDDVKKELNSIYKAAKNDILSK